MPPIELRLGSPGDDEALKRLAELDSHPLPPGPHLVAVRGGRIDAALSLSTGGLVADPFRRTAELAELLRFSARRLRRKRRRFGRGAQVSRPRRASSPLHERAIAA
jgi:hypothetical protein